MSLIISSAVCIIYYNPGIHITNKTGATDYVWQSNCFVSTMKEGIAWNHTDKNGYYNETAIDKNMNILIMGSSHMEGVNVLQKQKSSWLLEEITNRTVYNIGISGHDLLVCVKNLETALTVMEPTEYVIIETDSTRFAETAIDKCLSGKMVNIPSYDRGVLFHLQKIPYFKLVYAQFKSWEGVDGNDIKPEFAEEGYVSNDTMLFDSYKQLTHKIKEACDAHGVQAIIFYHPHLSINIDGTVVTTKDETSLATFQSACEANGVIFVDMTEDFINIYNKDHALPHGFCNTSIGTGHLNQYGHKAIAERLAEVIWNDSYIAEGDGK